MRLLFARLSIDTLNWLMYGCWVRIPLMTTSPPKSQTDGHVTPIIDSSTTSTTAVTSAGQRKLRFLLDCGQESYTQVHECLIEHNGRYLGLQQVEDIYFDTAGFSLLKTGFACCYRETLGKAALFVIPVDDLAINHSPQKTRLQHLSEVESYGLMDIALLPTGPARLILEEKVGKIVLTERFKVKITRSHYQITHGQQSQSVNLDKVRISRSGKCFDGKKHLQYSELFIDSIGEKSAVTEQLFNKPELSQVITSAPGNHFQRALKADGFLLKSIKKRQRKSINAVETTHDLFRETMQNQLQLIRYWESVAIEDQDEEGVHQMRVAIRRIRSTLKIFAQVLSKQNVHYWQKEFRWLGKRLAFVRDLDVLTNCLIEQEHQLGAKAKKIIKPYQTDVSHLRQQVRSGLITSLESERYHALLSNFQTWLLQEQCFFINHPLVYKSIDKFSGKLLKQAMKRIKKKALSVDVNTTNTDLHKFRIKCKQLRCSLNTLARFSTKDYRAVIAICKDVQRDLGKHQDSFENAHRLQRYALGRSSAEHAQDLIFYLGGVHTTLLQDNLNRRKIFFSRWKKYRKILLRSG